MASFWANQQHMINSNIVQVGLCLVDKYVDNLFFNAFPLLQSKRWGYCCFSLFLICVQKQFDFLASLLGLHTLQVYFVMFPLGCNNLYILKV